MRTGTWMDRRHPFLDYANVPKNTECVEMKFDRNVADRISKHQIRNTRIICMQFDNKIMQDRR